MAETTHRNKTWGKIPKNADQDLTVMYTTVAGVELVQLRDHLRTRDTPGRGIALPAAQLPRLIELLQGLQAHLGIEHGAVDPGENQSRLM